MTSDTATTMVGPYRLDGLIGRGGMGEVFKAFDTRRQRTIALKLLPESLSHDQEYRERFRRESLAAASLVSPHIVPIHDFGEVEGRLFIDMRLIEGADLTTRLDGHPVSVERAVNIVLQVCDALSDAHSRGVMHRDVKPSNILLTDSDFAYLVDFGIATTSTADTGLTATGTTVGTFGYMAPERFDGTAADPRADIYSLGCVLHELLTGRRPFADHNSTPSLIRAHLMLEPTSPSAAGVAVPPELDRIALRAMAKDPAQRFSTIHELAQALRAVPAAGKPSSPATALTSFAHPLSEPRQALIETQVASGPPHPPAEAATRLQSERRRRRTVVALAASLAIVLLIAGAFTAALIARSSDSPNVAAPVAPPASQGAVATAAPWSPPATAQPATAAFGETVEIAQGVTATASTPAPYRPRSTAAGDEGAARVVRVVVTLTNNTDHYINFGDDFYAGITIDGANTMSVQDVSMSGGDSVGGIPHDATAPGQTVTFGMAWALTTRTTPIELEIGPSSLGSIQGNAVTWAGDA
ncbi:serine/threonine-protein kinase [Actinomycetospora sp. C-140]